MIIDTGHLFLSFLSLFSLYFSLFLSFLIFTLLSLYLILVSFCRSVPPDFLWSFFSPVSDTFCFLLFLLDPNPSWKTLSKTLQTRGPGRAFRCLDDWVLGGFDTNSDISFDLAHQHWENSFCQVCPPGKSFKVVVWLKNFSAVITSDWEVWHLMIKLLVSQCCPPTR